MTQIAGFFRSSSELPDYYNRLMKEGVELLLNERHTEAIQKFISVVNDYPEFQMAHRWLGLAYEKAGRFDDAVAAHKRSFALKGEHADMYNIASAFRNSGNLDEAMNWILKFRQAEPTDEDGFFALAMTYDKMGDHGQEVATYRQGLRLCKGQAGAEIWYNFGVALSQTGEFSESIQAFERASDLAPNSAQVLAQLGQVSAYCNQWEKAASAYLRLSQVYPGAEVFFALGEAYHHLHDIDKSIIALESAVQLEPGHAPSQLLLAISYLNKGDPVKARACYRRAAALNPLEAKKVAQYFE